MTKSDAKKIAKKAILSAIGTAYYKIADDDTISDADAELIIEYINKYGNTACKALKAQYKAY